MCVLSVTHSLVKLVTKATLPCLCFLCLCVRSVFTGTLQPETFCWLTAGWRKFVTLVWHETSPLTPATCSGEMWVCHSLFLTFLPSCTPSLKSKIANHILETVFPKQWYSEPDHVNNMCVKTISRFFWILKYNMCMTCTCKASFECVLYGGKQNRNHFVCGKALLFIP